VEFTHPENGRLYKRVPEVIDCWFDSGAMSYAQWHYPFENQEIFEKHFPADYICEAIDQTRGWFYSLHAIATLVSDSVAYRNCVCLSHIVDKDGKKMSKSLGNIVNPYDVFDHIGADPLRWYFLARLAPESQKRISVDIIREVASSFVNTLWNTYGFFTLYASLDDVDLSTDVPLAERPEIDRWALALLHHTIETTTQAMDAYDARGAGEAIERFVDQLSNWYIRRNRRRFWKSEAGADKQSAYLTLYECLTALQKLIAPFMPFLAEAMYQNLARTQDENAPLSVHMSDWPVAQSEWKNSSLREAIDVIQQVVALGRAARESSQVRVRQPLAQLLVRVPSAEAQEAVKTHEAQVLEELNVKALTFIAADAELVSYRIKPHLPRVGKRYGKQIPQIRAALLEADGAALAAAQASGQAITLEVDGQSLTLEPDDLLIETESAQGYACAESGGMLVALDTTLNDDLLREGLAREIVRTVQDARKQSGLEVSDRIRLHLNGSSNVREAISQYKDWIMDETLASVWSDDAFTSGFSLEREVGDAQWQITLEKIS